jgi:hypothetical protein
MLDDEVKSEAIFPSLFLGELDDLLSLRVIEILNVGLERNFLNLAQVKVQKNKAIISLQQTLT